MDEQNSRLHAFEQLFDSSHTATEKHVEINSLRRLCARGIPSDPPHLRPLAYTLLLGSASTDKQSWRKESRRRRSRYYDLVRVFTSDNVIDIISNPPKAPLSSPDKLISSISTDARASSSKHRFLKRKCKPSGRSNPLGPFKRFEAGGKDISSDSSGEDSEAQGLEEGQARVQSVGKNAHKQRELPEPILTRKILTRRLELIEAEQYRIKNGVSKQTSIDSQTSNDRMTAEALDNEGPTSSPTIVLSPDSDPEDGVVPIRKKRLGRSKLRHQDEFEVPSRLASPAISVTDNDHAPLPLGMSDSITLLKSQEIRPPTPHTIQDLSQEIALGLPDTHVECLIRLLYVFFSSHKEFAYESGTVEIARIFYTLFASGGLTTALDGGPAQKKTRRMMVETTLDTESLPEHESDVISNEWSRHAEAETFWCLVAIMGELGDVYLAADDEAEVQLQAYSIKWTKRLKWADEGLYRVLSDRQMSPRSSPVYDRWLTTCLASALPVRDVLPLMDFILSEHPTSVSHNPKRESMIDVCTAMLILIRSDLIRASSAHMDSTGQKKDLWGNEMAEEVVFDMKDAHRPEHDRKLMFNRELSLIRDYPGEAVGIDEILRVAWDIRQQRTLASMESSEVDDTDLTDEENDADAEDSLINKLSSLATMASKDVADRWAHTQMSGSVLPRPKVVRESIEAGSNLFRQYAAGVQESDAAASVAKASSNLTASALARWSTPANLTSSNNGNDGVPRKRSTSVQSDWGVRMPSTGNIWGNMASAARQAATTVAAVAGAASVDNREDRLTALPPRPVTPKRVPSVAGANLSRRDTNLPPSHFISPRGSIVYPAGRHRHRTAQSDGKISLQSRLAAIATGATQAESPRERERTGIRPLMLSASARPASPPLSINSKSKSIDGGSPSNVFGSPVGSAASLDIEYYVPRKISLRRASGDGTIPVSSIGAARAGPTRRGIEQSHAKLRSATSGLGLGRPGMRSREPSSGPDDGNSKQRYALQDPGASRPHSPNDNPGENQRYQLSDAVSSSRHEDSIDASDDVVLSEISSVRVSRRGKVQSRPNGLKIHARKSIEDLNGVGDDVRRSTSLIGAVEANLPSPLMEEPATPPRKVDNIVELGYAPSDSQYGQLKRSSRMVRLDSTRSSKSAQGDEASGVETTPEGLRRDKDGYGDLLDNYAALEDL